VGRRRRGEQAKWVGWSLVGRTGCLGSVRWVEILPSPLVSTTPGHHPCEVPASWVLSKFSVSSQPTASSWPKTSVSCSSNWLWSEAKHVSIDVNCFVFGSNNSICLALGPAIGKYLANLF